MATKLAPDQHWIVGAHSKSLDQRVEYLLVDVDWPTGRSTQNERLAWTWAHEFAQLLMLNEDSGATDWVGSVWAGKKK
jgi:hypothetical protein